MKNKKRILSILLMVAMIMLMVVPAYAKKTVKPKIPKAATITVGKNLVMSVKGVKRNQVKWTSSNPDVAIVNAKGIVSAKSVGTAVITAKVGKKKANCVVTTVPQVYVLNTNTMKFHYPHCHSVADIFPEHRVDTTESRDEILAKGFVPCKNCNP